MRPQELEALSNVSLARARQRLRRVAWLIAMALQFMSWGGLAWLAWLGTERDLTVLTQDVDIISAGIWTGLAVAASSRMSDLNVLRAGPIVVITSSFTTAVVTGLNATAAEIPAPVLTWASLLIAIYPLLVPTSPQATLRVVLLATAVTPLGMTLGAWIWGAPADLPTVVASVVAPGVAAALAVAGSDLIHRSTVDIEALREQQALLDAVLGGVEEAIVLRDPSGHQVFASPSPLPEALMDTEGLLVQPDDRNETWLVTQKEVSLAGYPHRLTVGRRLTQALDQAEVESWKRLIRALAHELNNSLAPMSSLLHSMRLVMEQGDAQRLPRVVDALRARVDHLSSFLAEYAAFTRLPRPRPAEVEWEDFVSDLRLLSPFVVQGEVSGTARFDRAQLEQVVLNLLKNAVESGSTEDEITLAVQTAPSGWTLTVSDRGQGLSNEVLERATLPFFSTKAEGTGLGLALCRDIARAHGGWLALTRREGGGAQAQVWLPRADGAAKGRSTLPVGT
ncbi:MAG: HAMP domain-containing sensor histidine kinase [Myxococcota bacterium]